MKLYTKRNLYVAAALTTCLLLAWGIWRGFARSSNVDLGDGLFFETHLSGPDTNCILVQLPPRKDYKRPTLWSRLGLFQARLGSSAGPWPFTIAMKDVQLGGGFHHVLVTESLLREYGHDPAEFLPAHYKESRDYRGAKYIYFRRRSGHPRQWYECARESLTNAGIAVVEFGADIVLLVPQADAVRFSKIKAEDLHRRNGTAIDVWGESRGVSVQLERSTAGSRWMAYSPPFTNWFQLDQRMVVDYGPQTKWRVNLVGASSIRAARIDTTYDGAISSDLIGGLKSNDLNTRRRSAEALAQRREAPEQVVPALIEMAHTFLVPNMQAHILELIGQYQSRAHEALPVVLAFCLEPTIADRSGYVLTTIDPSLAANPGEQGGVPPRFTNIVASLLPQLLDGLQSTNQFIRWSSAWALAEAQQHLDEVIPALIDILRVSKDDTARRTVRALAACGTQAHLSLLEALDERSIPLRLGAANALAIQKVEPERAILALLTAHRHYPHPNMKKSVRSVIAIYGEEARRVLESVAQDAVLGSEAQTVLESL